MQIESGTVFEINNGSNGFFNSSKKLTVLRHSGETVQFTLGKGKGHGSMPVKHLQYLLRKNELTPLNPKRALLNDNEEEQLLG
ncbi:MULTISPECIES: hypothetical protein [Bacillus]|uniref:hypothetical protein n=1 Tax=Bacillus TaxID=1386 RepID=UPI000BB8C630|nr:MULTISPECIES: hypothetical protein [Bacillus]